MKTRLIDLLTSLACEMLDPADLDELSYRLNEIAREAMGFSGGRRGRYERGGRQPPHHHHHHLQQQQGGGGWRGYHDGEGGSAEYSRLPRPSFHGRGGRGGARRGSRSHPDDKSSNRHSNQENDAKQIEHRDPSVQEGDKSNENENCSRRGRGFRVHNHYRPRRS